MVGALFPGLPDELSVRCLAMTPFIVRQKLRSVCRSWRKVLVSPELQRSRFEVRNGNLEQLLCFSSGAEVDYGSCCLVFKLYDYDESCWCPLPPRRIWDSVGYSLKRFQCCGVSGGVVVAGGELCASLNEDALVSKAVWFFDLWGFSWYRLPDMHHLRSFPCMTSIGSSAVVISSQLTYFVDSMSSMEILDLDQKHWLPSPASAESGKMLLSSEAAWNLRTIPHSENELRTRPVVEGCFASNSELHILQSLLGTSLLDRVYEIHTDTWREHVDERFTCQNPGAKVLALRMEAGCLYALMSVESVRGMCHSKEERVVSVMKHNSSERNWDHVVWLPGTDKSNVKTRKRRPVYHLLGAEGKLFVLQSELTRGEESLPTTTLHVLNIAGQPILNESYELQILNRFVGMGQKGVAWEIVDLNMNFNAEIACCCTVSL